MIDDQSLVIGRRYFRVTYLDRLLQVPEIVTCFYVGKNLYEGDSERNILSWYFQNAGSYIDGGAFNTKSSDPFPGEVISDADLLALIFDRDGLISQLQFLHQ